MTTRGLIVGKFLPPHKGHHHLIDFAAAQVDRLHVIVCDRPDHDPPGALRAAWLREAHPTVEVLRIDDELDPDDSQAWAENSVRWLGFVPEVVFTSEDYGERFAECLGCRHVLVDRARRSVPISGTMVRSSPWEHWEFLGPGARAHYALRVVLVGAESTGKTTLAADLAARFGTLWAPEFGREVCERKLAAGTFDHWTSEEFAEIARAQCALENEAARRCDRVLVCDTDAFATAIWHRRYLGTRSAEVEAIARAHRRADLYVLTDVATPFDQDGLRDGESLREWMDRAFREELETWGVPWVEAKGTRQERTDAVAQRVERILEGPAPLANNGPEH